MAKLPTRNFFLRSIWTGDAAFSSSLFELKDWLRRAGSAYSSLLHQYFKVTGPTRIVVDIVDDMATFGMVIAFVLLAYALPPFAGTGDWWNRNREYAVTFTDVNGEIIGRRGVRQDDAVPLDELPPVLIRAVLATEDARFFDHFGVDVIGTLRALVRNSSSEGQRAQGGSSITQQVAKNLFLSPERTMRRKVHEAFLSLWIEARLSKEEILKIYLDRAYLGGGTYGVEAASQFYFGKSARDVGIAESAILAGLLKAPTAYAPHANPEASRARANVVLFRMLDAGYISQGELLQARRERPQIIARKTEGTANWFLDWAYEDTLKVLEQQRLNSEFVIEVKTTLNRKLQDESEKIVSETIAFDGFVNNFSQAASVTMSSDGAVRAIVGGRDYAESQFNRATLAKRQSGSSFKPFVFLAALMNGFTPDQEMIDGPVSVGGWAPKNYDGKYGGKTTLKTALARSFNSIPVKLWLAVGRDIILETTHKAGVVGELDIWPPMVLGTSSLSLMDLTTGYATFAGGGKRAEPYGVLEIRRPTGEVIYSREKSALEPVQAFPEEKIAELNSMMAEVVLSGTGQRAKLSGHPQAGKTGTNQSYRDAWYVGYTAHSVTGVWVGNDDFTPMNEVTGGRIPAPIWKRITEVADLGKNPQGFAGVPLDARYVSIAELDKETQVASLEETPDATSESAAGSDAEVQDVLNGMFQLFEKKPVLRAKPKQQVARKPVTRRAQVARRTPALPKASVSRNAKKSNLFERVFKKSAQSRKKKKKSTLDF